MKKSKAERRIPFDQPIKIILLAIHVIGFSAWFGGILNGQSIPFFFVSLTNPSVPQVFCWCFGSFIKKAGNG